MDCGIGFRITKINQEISLPLRAVSHCEEKDGAVDGIEYTGSGFSWCRPEANGPDWVRKFPTSFLFKNAPGKRSTRGLRLQLSNSFNLPGKRAFNHDRHFFFDHTAGIQSKSFDVVDAKQPCKGMQAHDKGFPGR